jgi:hypothetical protein
VDSELSTNHTNGAILVQSQKIGNLPFSECCALAFLSGFGCEHGGLLLEMLPLGASEELGER